MNYQKVTIQLIPDNQEFRDILMATLGEKGFESFVENENDIEAYIPSNFYAEDLMSSLQFDPYFKYSFRDEMIPEQNWNEVWEKNYFQPLLIANQCLIRAPFHKSYPAARYEIVIEPKMAFGTGNHETTTLMIEHILEINIKGKAVLDMGCGTGILAMLASMRKAASVEAIDIDQWAYESTLENCKFNKCKNITVKLGDASILGDQKFDIVFANIHKNVLIADMVKYDSVLNANGLLLMSGFYENDLADITQMAAKLNLIPLNHKMNNKWVAAIFQK